VASVAAVGACAAFVALVAAPAGPTGAPLRPLQTAFVDPEAFGGPDGALELGRARAAGASVVKVPLFWDTVAPPTRPREFDPSDPSDPGYDWTALDTSLRMVRAHGLTPLVYVSSAPDWAKRNIGGTERADPKQFAAFTLAAVRRYSGATPGLPRVRLWMAWNEPNKVPGREYKQSSAPWYRTMVNAFATSVHTKPGNLVVAGGLAPFGHSTVVAPLTFMRELLCVSSHRSPRPTCNDRVRFDIWATHPYTAGGPTHHAVRSNDVSLGELPVMKALLDAGVAARHVVSKQRPAFWVTEFSWDSNPPDPAGVPAALEGRWVAEALYRMWSAGVSLVTWFTIRDHPVGTSPYQSGLYFAGPAAARDRPKPALTAFRFPFVAFRHSRNVSVWGRTPSSAAARVTVEQRGASGWRRVATLRADRAGIFSAELRLSGKGPLRARASSRQTTTSLPFSLATPPDRVYQPFGT
jgi:hypothetical protein